MNKLRNGVKKRLSSQWIARLLVAAVVISVAGATIAFWIVGKRVEASLAEQMLHRQQVVARAGANSIEEFLASVSSSVSSYAQMENVITAFKKTPDFQSGDELNADMSSSLRGNPALKSGEDVIEGQEGTQDRLNLFVKRWLDTPVFSIALTDSEGIVTVSANRQGAGLIGDTLADRDYFKWARQSQPDDVFVGKAIYGIFGSVKDKFIVPVASGVYSEGEFKGVLIATVVLSELTKTYLDPLKISEDTRVYLIQSDGTILYAPFEKFIGINYFEYLAKSQFKGKEYAVEQLWKAATKPEEGKIDITLPNEETGEIDRFLISHSPINYHEEEHLTLAVASPINTALVFFPQFQPHQFGVLIFVIFVVLALSTLGLLAIRLAQREAFYEGFTRGRDHNMPLSRTKAKEKSS